MPNIRRQGLALLTSSLVFQTASAHARSVAPETSDLPNAATLRQWVEEIKEAPRGPFQSIQWFCRDGTIQPPKAYACADHGGGIQHGLWTDRVASMRNGGYAIANLLADIDAARFTGEEPDLDTLSQVLLERFLMGADAGWIFRGAFNYRGAFQIEDEEAGANALVAAMLADPEWRNPARFALLREAIRLLPIQGDTVTASAVRQLAIDIADKDSGFADLRAKIHGAPDADDAAAVREYASTRGRPEAGELYQELAAAIDVLYAEKGAVVALRDLAGRTEDAAVAQALTETANALDSARDTKTRFRLANEQMATLRQHFQDQTEAPGGLELMLASLALERDAYAAGNTLLGAMGKASRRDRIRRINESIDGLYGAGFLSRRQFAALRIAMNEVVTKQQISVDDYRQTLRYLSRVPEWSARWLEFNFGLAVSRFATLEPLAHLYSQDRLRGSPLLFYGATLDGLVRDANQLAGVRGELFGENIGAGLRALNPGIARGTIRETENTEATTAFDQSGIYLLPETTSDLPPVAGILTRGEGSSLSHVQLLARNLGIPNVVVTDALIPTVQAHVGRPAVLAVSPGGVVQLSGDGPQWDAVFGEDKRVEAAVEIRPDLEKLDLETATLLPLSQLRASDSGRTSGPKGANLGELKHYFGDAVPSGFVIPFGIFRKLLDQPLEPGGPPVFEWMKREYSAIAGLEDRPQERQRRISQFLARLRSWIAGSDPGSEFRDSLRSALEAEFGPDGSYGVFVRSDTNVEDLPGFTGAGLNLTVFNVVGFENILKAIHEVWASPFTERAYGWRQGNMTDPAYVFPAVVIQLAFPSEKSGVMVTTDVEQGEPGWVSIALSEGVGGAVDGQATESLRVDKSTGKVQFLAQATAPTRTALLPTGGVGRVPASGTSAVLQRAELDQLLALADEVEKFPSLHDAQGNVIPADIEFGFANGRLALLQIRPFVESSAAQQNRYLLSLDAHLAERGGLAVDLDDAP